MIFKERLFLFLSTKSEYLWYLLTALFLGISVGLWWHMLYRPWRKELRELSQELTLMNRNAARREQDQAERSKIASTENLSDVSQSVVNHVAQSSMKLLSLRRGETIQCVGGILYPFELVATGSFGSCIDLCNLLAGCSSFFMKKCEFTLIDTNTLRFTCDFTTINSTNL